MIDYSEYIKGLKWSYKREDILKNRRKCQKCESPVWLTVHHWSYKQLWFEKEKHLFVLCQGCHKEFHDTNGIHENMMKSTKRFLKSNLRFSKNYKNKKRIKKEKKREKLNIAKKNNDNYWDEKIKKQFTYF